MNNRRKLVLALGAGAFAVPFGSFAQQKSKVWRVGFLSPYQSSNDMEFGVFKQELRDLGHVEGKNITFEYMSADGNYDRLPSLAAELVRRNVDVIMATGGTPAATAAINAARSIPVVFRGVADPVGQGFVASLARPGGNVTGATNQNSETGGKLLALLKEIVPAAKRIAVLSNPTNLSLPLVLKDMQLAAFKLRLEITVVKVGAPTDFETAFAEIMRAQPAGLVILSDAMLNNEAARLTALAARHRLPSIGGRIAIPERGGLMSYGANSLESYRRSASLVDKILKGAKAADLPVEQPTKFDLVVNMKTAKALGIKIPNSILVQATKLIE
jgi:putative ABC transport system substrate-binding protein